MRRFVLAAAVVVGCNGTTTPEPAPPRLPPITLKPIAYHLRNGMTVYLVPDSHADITRLQIRYKVGAIDDPVGQEGVAHLAMHVSYAPPTGNVTLWDKLDRVATWIGSQPDAEHVDFTEQCAADDLEDVLKIEAERLARGCDGVTDTWFDWLKGEVVNELRTNDTRRTNAAVDHALYAASDPYRRAYDATPESAQQLTREQTCAFIESHFTPANAVVVVSGPIEPRAFQQMIERDLGAVPARAAAPRVHASPPATSALRTTASADVTKPTTAIAWPLPDDPARRAVIMFGASMLSQSLKTGLFSDDHQVLLWITDNAGAVDAQLALIRNALRTGVVDPIEFEKQRSRELTRMLSGIDSVSGRIAHVAGEDDLQAPIDALEQLDAAGFDRTVAAALDPARARIVELSPDGTRPGPRPASLSDPFHSFKGPSTFSDTAPPSLAPVPSTVLANAKQLALANGLKVIVVQTSPVPILSIRLAFQAGVAADPTVRPATATVAVAALQEVAHRGAQSADESWAVGSSYSGASYDSSGFGVVGPSLSADMLFDQFAGLTESEYQPADIQKGFERMAAQAKAPEHVLWDAGSAVRATVYGAGHPYGQARPPTERDLQAFDAREVETYLQRYLQPNNATLIVTGGFDEAVVMRLVHKTFDGWKGRGQPVTTAPAAAKPGAFARAESTPFVTLQIVWQGGPAGDRHEQRAVLGGMLSAISSRIGGAHYAHRQGGTYQIGGRFDPRTAAAEIAAIQAEIPQVWSGAPRYRAAFTSTLRRETRAYEAGAASAVGWSLWILFAVENGQDLAWLGQTATRSAHVTYDEVAALARTELALDRAVWLVSGPRDAVTATYAALGITPTWLP